MKDREETEKENRELINSSPVNERKETLQDPRYELVTCSLCLCQWQRIDYRCAAHQLTCGYPLPAALVKLLKTEQPYIYWLCDDQYVYQYDTTKIPSQQRIGYLCHYSCWPSFSADPFINHTPCFMKGL